MESKANSLFTRLHFCLRIVGTGSRESFTERQLNRIAERQRISNAVLRQRLAVEQKLRQSGLDPVLIHGTEAVLQLVGSPYKGIVQILARYGIIGPLATPFGEKQAVATSLASRSKPPPVEHPGFFRRSRNCRCQCAAPGKSVRPQNGGGLRGQSSQQLHLFPQGSAPVVGQRQKLASVMGPI